MSFNPNLPADGSPLSSAEMRGQFIALNDQHTALIAQQAAAIADLQSRVAALEASPPGGITQAQLEAAIATRAPKPAAMNPLNYGAGPDYDPVAQQGLFDFSATLLTTLQGP